MMFKVANDYLDYNEDIEVEKKIKLFENLDSSDGDFSYLFDVPETSKNIRLLGYPVPDSSSKQVYHRIDCDVQDDSGVSLYTGFLRIERRVKRDFISVSFFSGNSNWFGLISGNLSDLDMSEYDIEQTRANIISSWANTEGLTFPLVDNGGLLTRSYPQVKIEDLIGGFYVHTVFKKIFQSAQIKLTGELLEEPLYNKLITLKNSKSQDEIDARSTYAFSSGTARPENTLIKIDFTDDSTYPYYDGTQDNFSLVDDRYTADIKMVIDVQVNVIAQIPDTEVFLSILYIYINGVQFQTKPGQIDNGNGEYTSNVSARLNLEQGDYVEIFSISSSTSDIISATIKITPTFIYKTFGLSALPNWTKQQYISSIFQIFNVITSFDSKTKTLTCNLFDKLKEKTPIDISRHVEVEEIDYTDFISSFGRQSTFSYNQVEFNEIKDYNVANFFNYGLGKIDVDNDFLPEIESIIESEFSNPFSYLNPVFEMSMERTNLIELEEGESVDMTSVTDNTGIARFNIAEDIFFVGDVVRFTDSTNPGYNGDWVVETISAGWIEVHGLPYDGAATATVTKINFVYNNSDDVFLLVNIPTYPVGNFSSASILFEDTIETAWGTAYFSLLDTDRQINIDYKQSLSFGEIQDPLFYQRTILETYWSLVSRVLNDPVKPICRGHMPVNVYRSIDFLRPVIIKTLETSNLYYANLMSGYRGSHNPFRFELIKLP